MADFIPKNNIEEIAEGIILDYLQGKENEITCIDIEGLLVDYFKLNIYYVRFADANPNVDGFIADGITPLWIWEKGKRTEKVFQKGDVVFDEYLLRPENSSHRRFSFAHEGGHYASHQVFGTLLGANHMDFDPDREYTATELRRQFSFEESQVNAMAAAFLMPRFLLKRTLEQYKGKANLNMYGDTVMLQEDRDILKQMSDQLGVSPSALRIRLLRCGFINQKPIEKLVNKLKRNGGWGDA